MGIVTEKKWYSIEGTAKCRDSIKLICQALDLGYHSSQVSKDLFHVSIFASPLEANIVNYHLDA